MLYIFIAVKYFPLVKKIQRNPNYRNKWVQHLRRMDRDRQTVILNCEI